MSIETSGTATTSMPCQLLVLELTLRRRNPSSRLARERAKELLEKLHAKLSELSSGGVRFDKAGMAARFSVDTLRHSPSPGQPLAVEYEGVYRLTLKTVDHARFIEIFDAVTEIDGVEATSPRFRVDDAAEQQLRNDAFRSAAGLAKARFDFQCRVIGLEPDAFEVASWSYYAGSDDSSTSKLLRIDATDVTTSSGRVSVTITVRLTYEPKHNAKQGLPPC